MRDAYVDEYPVDDGGVDNADFGTDDIEDEAFVVEAAEETFVVAEDDIDDVVRVAEIGELAANVWEERVAEDGTIEDETVEDESVKELRVIGVAPVPGAWYISILYGPPQNSDELPLQGISHPEKPSGAGPPPPEKELPQSLNSAS